MRSKMTRKPTHPGEAVQGLQHQPGVVKAGILKLVTLKPMKRRTHTYRGDRLKHPLWIIYRQLCQKTYQ